MGTRIDKTNEGKRVELIYTTDQYTNLKTGDQGTYEFAILNDGLIQHAIKWDNGSSMMLLGGVDSFKFI